MLSILLLTLTGLQLASGQAAIPACSNPFLRYSHKSFFYLYAVFQIHDILMWIRIRIRGVCLPLMDPDPAIFVIDLQDANKKLI